MLILITCKQIYMVYKKPRTGKNVRKRNKGKIDISCRLERINQKG